MKSLYYNTVIRTVGNNYIGWHDDKGIFLNCPVSAPHSLQQITSSSNQATPSALGKWSSSLWSKATARASPELGIANREESGVLASKNRITIVTEVLL